MKSLYGEKRDRQYIAQQRKNGNRIGELTLCEDILFHHYFFCSRYICYSDIDRVFIRIQSGEYGDLPLSEYSLVVVDSSGKEHSLHVDHRNYAQETIEWLRERYSHIQIGKK